MRIAYILNTLETGGAERQILALAQWMRMRGHAVKIVVLREQRANHLRTGLDVAHLDMRRNPLSAAVGYGRAVRTIWAFHPNVIHGNQFHGNMLARMLRPVSRVPVISTIHNVYEGGWARMLAYRVTDPLTTRSVAVCEAAADRFASAGAYSRRKLRVIANGIDVKQFAPDAARHLRVRAELNAGHAFIWLAASRITPAKDVANLLRAFAQVHADEPSARLWIAGEGEPPYVSELHRLSEQIGVASAVHWLGLRDEVAGLLDAADAFVLSSAWEGMPLALGEAMAMEKPFVATDVGGVRELAGDCGTMVPAGDSTALADGMLATMRRSALERVDVGCAARARIGADFNIEAKACEWERCYAEIVAPA